MNTTRMTVSTVILALGLLAIPARAQDAASCEHHQAMAASLASIEKVIAGTKTSTDAAALRATLDQIQSEVTKMQENNKKCAGMMEMMEKMEKMQKMGKMKSDSAPSEEQHQHK